ncbi:AC3_0185 family rSAM-modified Cys-rich RiPP [Clostridium saccharoperbutylacetonicum]
MKHLLLKKVSNSREDVRGYGCWFGCDSTCIDGEGTHCSVCNVSCTGGCKDGCHRHVL